MSYEKGQLYQLPLAQLIPDPAQMVPLVQGFPGRMVTEVACRLCRRVAGGGNAAGRIAWPAVGREPRSSSVSVERCAARARGAVQYGARGPKDGCRRQHIEVNLES